MRFGWLLCLAAGCDFAASPTSTPTEGGDDDQGQGQDPGGTGSGTTNTPCDVTGDPSLRLCLSFDQQPMMQDLSDYGHRVTATAVTPVTHDSGSAVALTMTSQLHVLTNDATDSSFDVTQLTIDMWIAPAPASGSPRPRGWLLDNNGAYFMTFEPDGKVRCGINSQVLTSGANIDDTTWHHVACTYGSDQKLHVYVDGVLSGCASSAAIPTGKRDGIAIGANYGAGDKFTENYVGDVDTVHVYARALSDDEICTAAHKTNCRGSCDQEGGQGRPGAPGFP
jgi:Concanavalin A-like lectin/glucanases superfamily